MAQTGFPAEDGGEDHVADRAARDLCLSVFLLRCNACDRIVQPLKAATLETHEVVDVNTR